VSAKVAAECIGVVVGTVVRVAASSDQAGVPKEARDALGAALR